MPPTPSPLFTPTLSRRHFLRLAATGLSVAASQPLHADWLRLKNHCLDPAASPASALEQAAWQGINPADWWDCHAHIVGSGDGGSGISLSPDLQSPFWHPWQYLQQRTFANAACAETPGHQDEAFVTRLRALMASLPKGAKVLLYAFDKAHGASGEPDDAHTAYFVPNAYAQKLAQLYPDSFEWVASIHPYRADCVDVLVDAVAHGARAVKWLPSAMAIDPASPQCGRFYRAAAQLNIPIISHGGEEKAMHGAAQAAFGNPLRLRRALDAGVRIVVAHCASIGNDTDDNGKTVRSFDCFAKLMAEPQWQGRLFGDISAITMLNRDINVLKTLLTETAWHNRLLYGSDYPLPAVLPLISARDFAHEGLLPETAVAPLEALQDYHALRFDFVLKRHLSWQGKRFGDSVFATRQFFSAPQDVGVV